MPYELSSFNVTNMMECRGRVRSLFESESTSVTEAARRVVDFFYHELVDEHGAPACALVRFFKTEQFGNLDPDLQAFALKVAGTPSLDADVRCLTLLATEGQEPEWRRPELSRGHRAIPLTSIEFVEQAPMIAQLIKQLGLSVATVVRPEAGLLLDAAGRKQNVFYVPEALGSPHIVAQAEFVKRYRIASVIGLGGLITTGDMFATILFSKVPISREVADLFSVIGLNLKIAILPIINRAAPRG
jgi:two-component system NtrC family sensor kinase